MITFKCDEYECIVAVFKMLCSRRDAGKNRVAPEAAGQQERQGSWAVFPTVLFFCYFAFFYACPIIMSLPFMMGSSTVNNKVVYRYDERSGRFQLRTRISAEEFVPRRVPLSASFQLFSQLTLLASFCFQHSPPHHHNHPSSQAGREEAPQHPESAPSAQRVCSTPAGLLSAIISKLLSSGKIK